MTFNITIDLSDGHGLVFTLRTAYIMGDRRMCFSQKLSYRCRIALKTVMDIDQCHTNATRWFSHFFQKWSKDNV